jgi:hypothetical protein
VRLVRGHPVVVGARVFLLRGADEGEVLDARDVARVRARDVAVGEGVRVERRELLSGDQLVAQPGGLRWRPVTPVDTVRLRQLRDFRHPGGDLFREFRERNERASGCRHGTRTFERCVRRNADYNEAAARITDQAMVSARQHSCAAT